MYKFLFTAAKIICLVTAVLILFKIRLYRNALLKQQVNGDAYDYKIDSNISALLNQSQVLEHLEDLTAIPLIGALYEQQKIDQLLRLQRFSQALDEVGRVLNSKFKRKSYRLWFSKSKAEFALGLFEDCEQSLTRASSYAKRNTQDYQIGFMIDVINKNKAIERTMALVQHKRGIKLKRNQIQNYLEQIKQKEKELM